MFQKEKWRSSQHRSVAVTDPPLCNQSRCYHKACAGCGILDGGLDAEELTCRIILERKVAPFFGIRSDITFQNLL